MTFPLRVSPIGRFSTGAAAALMLTALAACGGGGGGGSSGGGSLTPVTFSSWGALPTGRLVDINGMSITRNSVGTILPVDSAGSMARVLYDNLGLDGVTFITPTATTSWTTSSTGRPNCSTNPGLCAMSSRPPTGQLCTQSNCNLAALSDPYATGNNWNYQSFGVWTTIGGTVNAMSYGAPTAASAVLPLTGMATYIGGLQGRYMAAQGDLLNGETVSAGVQFGLAATVTAVVNFDTRQIDFSTASSTLQRQGTPTTPPPAPFPDSRFNVSSTALTISSSANAFSGAIVSGSNGMGLAGNVDGRFYGPNAEELGGVVGLVNGNRALIGGFGAKR